MADVQHISGRVTPVPAEAGGCGVVIKPGVEPTIPDAGGFWYDDALNCLAYFDKTGTGVYLQNTNGVAGQVLTSNGDAVPTWQAGIPGPQGIQGIQGIQGVAGANGVLQKTTVNITSAQILDLHNTAIELVPAPVGGSVLVPVAVFLFLKFVTTAYTIVVSSDVCIDYLPQAGTGDLMVSNISTNMNKAWDVLTIHSPSQKLFDAGQAAAAIGQSLVLKLGAGGQLTLGDGTMKVVTYYDTVSI